jgi:transcriptional regulator with XRE-family HTH domain
MTDQQLRDNRLHIGQRIAQLRDQKGWTQAQLAHAAGMKQQHISRIEKGLYDFRIEGLLSILAALDHKIEFAEVSMTDRMIEKAKA